MTSTNEKILLVDDDESILRVYSAFLSKKYHVVTATESAVALEMLETRGPFALVIADYQMPGMNGVELINAIKGVTPATLCILHSGYGLPDNARLDPDSGISKIIAKPCSFEELGNVILECMEHYRKSME